MDDDSPPGSTRQPMTAEDLADAASLLRRVLTLVEAGELEAKTPEARALMRRLEGAALAAEVAAGEQPDRPS